MTSALLQTHRCQGHWKNAAFPQRVVSISSQSYRFDPQALPNTPLMHLGASRLFEEINRYTQKLLNEIFNKTREMRRRPGFTC